jgi:integrase
MFTDSFDNVYLKTTIDARKANKNGLYLVRFRITFDKKQFFYKSGIYCKKEDWKTILEGKKTKETKELRERATSGHDAIKANIKAVIAINGVFSFDKFNNLIKKNTSDTLNAAFIAKINETKSDGKIGTSIYYNCALKSIEKFAGNNILFSDITVKWLTNYEKHMIDNDATYTTVGMYCRALRTIINVAKENNIIKPNDYPFGAKKGLYQIPTGEGRSMALTLQQIGELMKAEVSETENKYRDLWFFSYLCNGINIGDLCRLKHSDIENDIISFYRQKTINTSKHKVKIEAVLLPQMKEIIKRWNANKNQTDYVFPFLTGKEDPTQTKKQVQNITRLINKHIGRIAKRIDIESISTYTARHSFATVLKRSGANIAYISESLGHTDIKTTTSYLDSFEKAEQQKNANLLIPKI